MSSKSIGLCRHRFSRCSVERFYVSKILSVEGFYEIHTEVCDLIPSEGDRLFLGMSRTSDQAVAVAQNLLKKVCPCECCLKSAVATQNRDACLGASAQR